MRNSVEIGKIIKNRRTAMNLKQTDFADRLGIHKSTLSKYEKGLRKIPMEDIGKMADVLGMSIEDLLLEKQTVTETPRNGGVFYSSGIKSFGRYACICRAKHC